MSCFKKGFENLERKILLDNTVYFGCIYNPIYIHCAKPICHSLLNIIFSISKISTWWLVCFSFSWRERESEKQCQTCHFRDNPLTNLFLSLFPFFTLKRKHTHYIPSHSWVELLIGLKSGAVEYGTCSRDMGAKKVSGLVAMYREGRGHNMSKNHQLASFSRSWFEYDCHTCC